MEDVKSASQKRSANQKPRKMAEKRPCMDMPTDLPTTMLLLKGTSVPCSDEIPATIGVEVVEISPSSPASTLVLPMSLVRP